MLPLYSCIKIQWKSKTGSFYFFPAWLQNTAYFCLWFPYCCFFVCKFSICQCHFLFFPILPSFLLLIPFRCSVCFWRHWWTSSRSIKKICRTGCLYCWPSYWRKWVLICLGLYKQKFRRHLMSQGNKFWGKKPHKKPNNVIDHHLMLFPKVFCLYGCANTCNDIMKKEIVKKLTA